MPDPRRAGRPLRLGLLGVLAGALLLAGCGGGSGGADPVSGVGASQRNGYHGIYLDDPYPLPTTALTDTDGKPFALADQKAPLKIVFFGYSHCPDICQIVMSTIATALVRVPESERAKVQVSFVTTDPARDTPAALRSYLDRFNPDFIGLTGPLSRISAAGKPLHVYVEQGQKLASGGYEVDHSTYTYAALGTGVRVIWDQATSPRDMAADIIKLLEQKESA